MQIRYRHYYHNHHLCFEGEGEVENKLFMLEPSKALRYTTGAEFCTIRFPAHMEIPRMPREVVPGEHIAPCSACDNLHIKALALNTLFVRVHMGTSNCSGAAPACKAPGTPCSCKVQASHACSSLPLHFSLQHSELQLAV